MASRKRFIDAELFQDEWFKGLRPEYKLAWVFLLTNCDEHSRWKASQKIISFHVGFPINLLELKKVFGEKIIEEKGGRVWFVPELKKSITKYTHTKYLYVKNRLKSDTVFRIMSNLRSRVRSFLNGKTKSHSTAVMLGCNRDQLKKHIEGQFSPGMNWNNYGRGGWHIDHIIPLSSINKNDDNWRDKLELLCHHTNLQPLWESYNIKKGGANKDG